MKVYTDRSVRYFHLFSRFVLRRFSHKVRDFRTHHFQYCVRIAYTYPMGENVGNPSVHYLLIEHETLICNQLDRFMSDLFAGGGSVYFRFEPDIHEGLYKHGYGSYREMPRLSDDSYPILGVPCIMKLRYQSFSIEKGERERVYHHRFPHLIEYFGLSDGGEQV